MLKLARVYLVQTQQDMGVASGWNRWVWLECLVVVSGCCCKKVYKFSHNITCPYSTCRVYLWGEGGAFVPPLSYSCPPLNPPAAALRLRTASPPLFLTYSKWQ